MSIKCKLILRCSILICLTIFSNLSAQYFFGKNKFQFTKYNWKQIQTEYFDIYYYEQEQLLAEYCVHYANESVRDLIYRFEYIPKEKIPIILYSSSNLFQETNTVSDLIPENVGGFTDFIKGRVVLPFNGSISDFNHILKHELTHAFMLQYISDNVDSRELFFFTYPPVWFSEGLAEYSSEIKSPEMELILRSATIESKLIPPYRLDEIYGTYKMYKEGQGFLNYLYEKYSDEKLMRLLPTFITLKDFDNAFQSNYGIGLEDESKNWVYEMRKKYLPTIQNRDEPLTIGKLVFENEWIFSPVIWNEDSTYKIIFMGEWMGYTGIYKYENKKIKNIIKGEFTDNFEAIHFYTNRMDISDSGKLTFSAKSRGKDILYIYDLKRNKTILKKEFENIISISSPTFSPSTDTIAFSGSDIGGINDLYLYINSADSLIKLTDDIRIDKNPAYSKDGKSIAFISDRNGNFTSLYTYKLDEKKIYQIAKLDGNIDEPRFSKNNDIVFTLENFDGRDIYILKNDNIYKISNITTGFSSPIFTPKCDSILTLVWLNESYKLFKFSIEDTTYICTITQDTIPEAKILLPSLKYQNAEKVNYKKKLSLDLAQGTVSTEKAMESGGGLELFMTDMVGEHQMYLLFFTYSDNWQNFLKETNILLSYTNQTSRLHWTMGAYHFFSKDYAGYYENYEEESSGILAGISYPLSRFRRIESTMYLRYNSRKDLFPEEYFKGTLATLNLSYIKDNSHWDGIGPVDGERYNLTAGITSNIETGELYSSLASLDYRKYIRLTRNGSWANRLILRGSWGDKPDKFYMGGTWSFRGYPFYYFMGNKLYLINSEIRFPFIEDFYLKFPYLNMRFGGIKGAIFADCGETFNDDWVKPRGSFGLSWRINLAYYTVLRFDLAWRTDFKTIEPHTQWDLFFGWDY